MWRDIEGCLRAVTVCHSDFVNPWIAFYFPSVKTVVGVIVFSFYF